MRTRALTREDANRSISSNVSPASGSHADEQFFVSFGLIVSCRLSDVDKIRTGIQNSGGKIIFQTVSNGPLFLLRAGQIERILQGDLNDLAEIHKKKERRSEK